MELQGGMDLQEVITAALSSGCGWLISWIMDQIIKAREEDGNPVSPKTKRRVAFGLCIAIPSVLVGILFLITWQYSWQSHIVAVGVAFATNQMIHGEQKLLTGKEVRRRARIRERLDGGSQ